MRTGFTTLFDRSGYSSRLRIAELTGDEKEKAQQQRERFAGAMLGFGLDLDPSFRTHFLRTVCGFERSDADQNWSVLVEPHNWCDLVLVSDKTMTVVELKIDADLKPHQNPGKSEFELLGDGVYPDGYALGMKEFAVKNNLEKLIYVTLEKRASWHKREIIRNGIHCRSAEWGHLIREKLADESIVESAIYDCLVSFGITVFLGRKMKNMKLGENATNAVALLSALFAAHGQEDIDNRDWELEPEFIGLKMRPEVFPGIQDVVKSTTRWVGWFGYESDNPPGSRLSFWFHCMDSVDIRASEVAVTKILRGAGFGEPGSKDGRLFVYCKAAESTDDKEWFDRVFAAFNN